jgi:hypothetical protein
LPSLGILIDDVEKFGVYSHVGQVESELIAEACRQSFAALLGYVEAESVPYPHSANNDFRGGREAAADAAGEDREAGHIATNCRAIDFGFQGAAGAFQRETRGFGRIRTPLGQRGSDADVQPSLANYPAYGRRNIEVVSLARDPDKDGWLASADAIKQRKEALVRIPMDPPLGCGPFGAILPARSPRAVRQVENHCIRERFNAADRPSHCVFTPRVISRRW